MSLELTDEQYLNEKRKDKLVNLRRNALELSINRNKNYQALSMNKTQSSDDSSYNVEEVLKEADKYYEWLSKDV